MKRMLAILCAACALVACGEKPQAKPEPKVRGVFDAQLQALDKAKGVEQTLQQGAEAQRQAIDEAEKK